MVQCAKKSKVKYAKMLAGNDFDLHVKLINTLHENDNSTAAAQLIKDYKYRGEIIFPHVMASNGKKKVKLIKDVGKTAYKTCQEKPYLSIVRVEELLDGFTDMQATLVEDLLTDGRNNEAKGVVMRNGLIDKLSAMSKNIVEQWSYD